MARPPRSISHDSNGCLQRLFAPLFGALLGLSLLKFGNPVLLNDQVTTPGNVYEWVLTAWPLGVGQGLLILLVLLAIFVVRKRPGVPGWLVWAPLPWLAWQFVAATGSVDMTRTTPTLIHFVTNIGCFYLGLYCLSPIRDLRWFWTGLMTGFVLVLLNGWEQHFGGLATSREYFFKEVYPHLEGETPEGLLRRISSDRVFATLFYPNTLAGVILLLAPVGIGVIPGLFRQEPMKRMGLLLTLVLAAGCLVWSGSKAGWLFTLGLALVALFRLRFPRALKVGLAIIVLAAGTAGFLWKYSGYLRKGARSAVARMDYWEAAVKVTAAHPLAGTGPGTFGEAYARVKRPESEMTRLTHNDYLQQASDSGLPGFLFYTGFIAVMMSHLGRRAWRSSNPEHFWIWLGLLGINVQSLSEFGWYIPAIAWPTMTLMGWLSGTQVLSHPAPFADRAKMAGHRSRTPPNLNNHKVPLAPDFSLSPVCG